MPYGAVAHRNVPKQRVLFPLPNGQTADRHPRVSVGGLAVFLCRFAHLRCHSPSEGGRACAFLRSSVQ